MRLGKSPWNEVTNKQGQKMRADIFNKVKTEEGADVTKKILP